MYYCMRLCAGIANKNSPPSNTRLKYSRESVVAYGIIRMNERLVVEFHECVRHLFVRSL